MTDGADGADAFSGLAAYARAWGDNRKMASVASAASGSRRLLDSSCAAEFPVAPAMVKGHIMCGTTQSQ